MEVETWYPGTRGAKLRLKIGRLVSESKYGRAEPRIPISTASGCLTLPLLESSLVGNRRYFSLIGLEGYQYSN